MNKVTKRSDMEEEDFLNLKDNIYSKPSAFQHDLFLTKEITNPSDYNHWMQVIQTCSNRDTITVHINSPGGSLDTGVQLYGALSSTPAMVTVSVEGACCSAASMVMMAADSLEIDPNSYFLIHSYTGGEFGKFNNLQENAQFQKNWFPSFIKNIYKDFLSEEEIERVLDGKDLWLTSEEVMERFEHVADLRQARILEENPEYAKQLYAAGIINELPKPKKEPKKENKTPPKKRRTH